MFINSVSFGNKIPIAKCKVIDVKNNKPVDATLYEFDCKDANDVLEFYKAEGQWQYMQSFINEMENKSHFEKVINLPYRKSFYALQKAEAKDGDFLCIAQTKDSGSTLDLDVIEAEGSKKYKYAGTAMIAGLGFVADKINKQLKVPVPYRQAKNFYEKCNFEQIEGRNSFIMTENGARKLQNTLESKTQYPIINMIG